LTMPLPATEYGVPDPAPVAGTVRLGTRPVTVERDLPAAS
jgi:hypothetical protein